MRVAVLWTGLSGYLNACLRELASRPGVELFVAHSVPDNEAPFDSGMFAWMEKRVMWRDGRDFELVQSGLASFDPELVVVAGWHVPIYRRILKPLKGRCLRLMTMDNCWNGTLKQWVGSLISPFYVLPIADAAWVPGVRQATFAKHLKFPIRSILHGLLSCEHPVFAAIHQRRVASGAPLPKAFIFVGRLSPEKDIPTMLAAYERYRAEVEKPWPLIICGTGPLQTLLEGKPGIVMKGFVQPADLPNIMATAGCLLLPSAFEPWALVINEATAAGLIVIASENVGSVPHLVQNYYNGFVVSAGDPTGLTESMTRISTMNAERRERMSGASHQLSLQYTPTRWADSLLEFAADRKAGNS